jgi:hypothetical protein
MRVFICFLGLHKWRYFRSITYPEIYRICEKCGRTEELLYNMFDFEWEENETRGWILPGDIEITNTRLLDVQQKEKQK